MEQIEILKQSLQQRVDEIAIHQMNIDNYRRAIDKIDKLPSDQFFKLADFKGDLQSWIRRDEVEQLKSIIMLQVLQERIEELGPVVDME